MRAMVFRGPGTALLEERRPVPRAARGEVLLRVEACGICRTDLHLLDGELPEPRLPVVPGHQIVARVAACGDEARRFRVGDRVGVPWLGGSCGGCEYCARGEENLCPGAVYTGCQRDGGFAEYCVADERFCFPIPQGFDSVSAAPLLCAGLIGYRAWRCCAGASRLGLYGFGSAAHILAQLARSRGQAVYAFTRAGDASAQAFARSLGACWAGAGDESPPEVLDAAIIFAPDGSLVPAA
ncbi:MAG: alcohol dehydrogenase catalytic domain-containing protein, partial [Gammaproteobacteria bacterium]